MRRIKPWHAIFAATTGICALLGVFLYLDRPRLGPQIERAKPAPPVAAAIERQKIDIEAVHNRKQAAQDYRAFVVEHKKSHDPLVQDQVAFAHIKLGYLEAHAKNYEAARVEMKKASLEYKGTNDAGEYGSLPDQAEYQAAVCLQAEGKKREARQAYEKLLTDRPLSPLAKATYRRLAALSDAKSSAEYENVLQRDIKAQENKAHADMVSCGPRALQYLLPLLLKAEPINNQQPKINNVNALRSRFLAGKISLDDLTKLCGTGKDGTTLDGMRKALKAFGFEAYGVQVNRKDFVTVQTPALMLAQGHFIVVTEIKGDTFTYFDPYQPAGMAEREYPLPPEDTADFSATMLIFTPLHFSKP